MRRTVFALALSLLIFSPALAATTVPTGPLSGNTTWSLANSPYILSNSVTVPTGTTLTVEPGVVVKFDWTYAALTVEGTLSAIGATDTPIIFTSYADDTAGGDTNGDGGLTTPGTATYLSWGDWSGLVFAPGSLATLQHVSARYGGRSFYAGAGMASIPLLSNQGGTVLLDDVELRAHASLVDTFSQSAGETTMQYVRTSEARNGVLVTGGVLTAHQSILEGTNYALLNTSGAPVDATLNWWGSPDGPNTYWSRVSDNVVYAPWLLSFPYTTPAPIVSLRPSSDTGYINDLDQPGIEPNTGSSDTSFTFKTVYTNSVNQPPTSVRLVVNAATPDAPCQNRMGGGGVLSSLFFTIAYAAEGDGCSMELDLSADPSLHDGDYTNGEQYTLTLQFPEGNIEYFFEADGLAFPDSLSGVFALAVGTPLFPTLSFAPDAPEGLSEDDGIQDHKGTANQTVFTFSLILTNPNNQPFEHPNLSISGGDTPFETQLSMQVDTANPSLALHDGDLANGEAYIATSTFPKGSFRYMFFTSNGTLILQMPEMDTYRFETGYSNVAFIPGLEASRLYEGVGISGENQLWEPNRNADVERLYLSSTTGLSLNDVYTRDIIDEANIIPDPTGLLDGNVYKNFSIFMDEQVVGTGLIHEWKAIPYDWRYDFDVLYRDGQKIGDNVYYGLSDREQYIVSELARLARTSDTGKVTIITHSNGGLLAKYILATMGANNDAQLGTIDKVIMVAAPQLGTPGAVEGLLHGDKQQLGLTFVDWGFLMDEERSRELGENMQSAFNLLPSTSYFSVVSDPVLTFDPSADRAYSFSSFYGMQITTPALFKLFLSGEGGDRIEPSSSDEETPNVLKYPFLQKSIETHTLIDSWVPPESIQVIQIAGWGEDTIKNIHYSCGFFTCTSLSTLDRKINQTLDGDGTVVEPSATWMSTSTPNIERWWVNLAKNNEKFSKNRDHASILEVENLQKLIKSIISGSTVENDPDEVIVGNKPDAKNISDRLRLTMHSPVDLHLHDSVGNHTGIIPNPDSSSDIRFYEKSIPNSYYREYGETKYLGADTGTSTYVRLQGLALGTYTLEIEQVTGDNHVTASTTFSDIPVTASTTGTMFIPQGGFSSTSTTSPILLLDMDGDGTTDLSLKGDSAGVSEEELISIIKGMVKTLHLSKNNEKQLIKKIEKLEKELAKEHKHHKIEKWKTEQVFIELLKTINRYEKKYILTTSEASDLRNIVEQIRSIVIK